MPVTLNYFEVSNCHCLQRTGLGDVAISVLPMTGLMLSKDMKMKTYSHSWDLYFNWIVC